MLQIKLVLVILGVAVSAKNITLHQRATSTSYITLRDNLTHDSHSLLLNSHIDDLATVNFTDKARSACIKGPWLLYENPNYNEHNEGGVMWAISAADYCFSFFTQFYDKVSSLRPIGNNEVWNDDSITLFSKELFEGKSYLITVKQHDVSKNYKTASIIITGTASWTIYSEPNLEGYSTCILTNSLKVTEEMNILNFGVYPDLNLIDFNDYQIKSVKKGCFSQNIPEIKPDEVFHHGVYDILKLPDSSVTTTEDGDVGSHFAPSILIVILLISVSIGLV